MNFPLGVLKIQKVCCMHYHNLRLKALFVRRCGKKLSGSVGKPFAITSPSS